MIMSRTSTSRFWGRRSAAVADVIMRGSFVVGSEGGWFGQRWARWLIWPTTERADTNAPCCQAMALDRWSPAK